MASRITSRSNLTRGDALCATGTSENCEYENPDYARLDEAIKEAIIASEEAGCNQLASEFTSQLGYLRAIHGK